MKGKLDIREMSFDDFENMIQDRFFRHRKELKLKGKELPDYLIEFGKINFQSGVLNCIVWLRDKGVIKIKDDSV